jgi:hypothetical protein
MAIRQQKQKDWDACIWWVERGLALYGNNAAREDAVEDLLKRRNRALSKLETRSNPTERKPSNAKISAPLAERSDLPPPTAGLAATTEILVCTQCGTSFERMRVRGRKPLLCPGCQSRPVEP